MAATQSADKTRPDYITDAERVALEEVELCRDVTKGTAHLRSKNRKYLPQHPGEEDPDYLRRLNLAVLFNAMERTITGLSGMVFRSDPKPGDDVPQPIQDDLENIDNAGTHFDVFAHDLFEDGLEAGHAGILVDAPVAPVAPGRRLSVAEEQQAGIRPYWVHVRKEQMLGPRTIVENGRTLLQQIVIWDPTEEPDGEFGTAIVDRYRVYRRIREGSAPPRVEVEVWRKTDKDPKPVIEQPATVVTNQTEIPLAVYYAGKTGYIRSQPPLADLAHTNIAHYQTLADHRYCLHIANVPTPWITGYAKDQDQISFGPNAGIRLSAADAKIGYLEPTGASFEHNMSQLQEFKADMAAMGLNMLQRDRRAAETARANEMDQNVEQSALAAAARSLQDCLEAALGFHAKFRRLTTGGSVVINREFEDQTLGPQEVEEYSQLVLRGQWSLRTLWAKLTEGHVNPEDFDPDTEEMRINAYPEPHPVTFTDQATGVGSKVAAA